MDHLKFNGLYEKFQSAYTEGRSCETGLVRAQNDIRKAMDQQEVSFIILLDMLVAFDNISHNILIARLSAHAGITALNWIVSYLTDRREAVRIEDVLSDELPLDFSVPQGSVSGSLYVIIFTLPFGEILRRHGLNYHFYADNNQDYLSFKVKYLDRDIVRIHAQEQW